MRTQAGKHKAAGKEPLVVHAAYLAYYIGLFYLPFSAGLMVGGGLALLGLAVKAGSLAQGILISIPAVVLCFGAWHLARGHYRGILKSGLLAACMDSERKNNLGPDIEYKD